jgi:hypothetical protein
VETRARERDGLSRFCVFSYDFEYDPLNTGQFVILPSFT